MLTEEYGLPREIRSEWKAAIMTFSAFFVCGLVPLLPFVFETDTSFMVSILLTGVVFFLIGSAKSFWSTSSWQRSGAVTLAVGGTAAVLAYFVGMLLRSIGG